mgnify:CR=1 FL=1
MWKKKPGFDVEANGLKNELTSLLGIKDLTGLRLLNRYDVEGIDEALFNQCVSTVFSEPPVDNTYAELPAAEGVSFAVEYLPGQFDQRAASAAECIQLISQGERPLVRSARVYLLEGALTPEQVAEIKKYVINPVEAREASLETKETLKMDYPVPAAVAVLEGFNQLDEAGLAKFIEEKGSGHGSGGHQVLPGVLPHRAARPHHHRDQDDRHLLVRSLPPHHLRHHSGRCADR